MYHETRYCVVDSKGVRKLSCTEVAATCVNTDYTASWCLDFYELFNSSQLASLKICKKCIGATLPNFGGVRVT